MLFLNLTPHAINIFDSNKNEVLQVNPSGLVARIETKKELVSTINSVEMYETKVTGNAVCLDVDKNEHPFPDQKEGQIIIVSGLFRSHFDRDDLYQPGELVRDDSGRPIGCIGLSR